MEAATTSARRAAPGTSVLGVASPRYGERAIKALLFGAALISVLTTVGIVLSLLRETLAFFAEVPIVSFLTGVEWSPLFADPEFGVLPLFGGSMLISAISLVVAIPLGLGSALYLSEYARPRTRRVLKPVLEVLAGIPTIVFGYFALTWVTPTLLQDIAGVDAKSFNALSAGLVLGLLVLPTIASVADDAMTSVPGSLREGA